jgi:hypothetical protein
VGVIEIALTAEARKPSHRRDGAWSGQGENAEERKRAFYFCLCLQLPSSAPSAPAVEFGFPAHSSLTVHRTMPRLCGERLPFPCLRLPPSVFSSNLTHRGGLYIKGYNPETFDPSVRLYFLTAFASLTMRLGLPVSVLRSHGGQISFPREGYAFSEANVSEFAELSPCPRGCG